jgi:hypothetical protein
MGKGTNHPLYILTVETQEGSITVDMGVKWEQGKLTKTPNKDVIS